MQKKQDASTGGGRILYFCSYAFVFPAGGDPAAQMTLSFISV